MRYPDGIEYQGEWRGGERHGVGKQFHPDGSTYYGDFAFDKKDGTGFCKEATGEIYKERWQGGERQARTEQGLIQGTMGERCKAICYLCQIF